MSDTDHESFDSWLAAHGWAWEARDPQAAADLFSEDATYRETPFEKPARDPIQPMVVRTGLDQALKAALRESLLGTEADPLTRTELEEFGLKRFAAVGEEDYDAGRLPRPSPGR